MIIDAMDLLYTNRFDGFCLVSSDSNFTRLASRIRESGLVVYGFGERKTSKPFVPACDKFIYVENLNINRDEQAVVAPWPVPATTGFVAGPQQKVAPQYSSSPASTKMDGNLKRQLRMAVEAASDEDGWFNLVKVGSLMTKVHPDFDPRTYGFTKFGELVAASNLFDIDRRTPGKGKPVVVYARDKRLKSVLGGFSHS
ncbi:OST-HTH/LOTUS domain containing protein [Rhypophila decipiens]